MHHLCPNLMALINHFNFVSRAVASVIVKERQVRLRAKLYEKFVALAEVRGLASREDRSKANANLQSLRSINSFNLLVAVVSGLNNSGVGRLKWTKERVSTKAIESLESLETLTSMQQSYKNYRQAITALEPPMIPYM